MFCAVNRILCCGCFTSDEIYFCFQSSCLHCPTGTSHTGGPGATTIYQCGKLLTDLLFNISILQFCVAQINKYDKILNITNVHDLPPFEPLKCCEAKFTSYSVVCVVLWGKLLLLADPGGTRDGPTSPSVQFLSFSCSFRQKSCQIILIGPNSPPVLENLGCATATLPIKLDHFL